MASPMIAGVVFNAKLLLANYLCGRPHSASAGHCCSLNRGMAHRLGGLRKLVKDQFPSVRKREDQLPEKLNNYIWDGNLWGL